MTPVKRVCLLLAVCFSCIGASAGSCTNPLAPAASQTGEQYCSAIGLYFCGITQSNLQTPGLPSGVYGYCMAGVSGIGLVGYSAHTYNGGAFPVTTQSQASDDCNSVGSQCSGYARCTRQ